MASDWLERRCSPSSWVRRLIDGRGLVITIVDKCPLPDGVNDAVVATDIAFGEGRDETEAGKGLDTLGIIENGWRNIARRRISLSEALRILDGE